MAAGKLDRTLKNRGKKTVQKRFYLAARNSQHTTYKSQPSPPRSKKLAVDLGLIFSLTNSTCWDIIDTPGGNTTCPILD
jgi:hypothetical protein